MSKKCNLCQDFVNHWTFQCPKLICANCNENGHARKNCPKTVQIFPSSCEIESVEDNFELKQCQFDSAIKTYIFIKAKLCTARNVTPPPMNSAIFIVKLKSFPSEVNLVTNEIKLKHSQLEVFDIVILINRKCMDLCSHDIIKELRAMF